MGCQCQTKAQVSEKYFVCNENDLGKVKWRQVSSNQFKAEEVVNNETENANQAGLEEIGVTSDHI